MYVITRNDILSNHWNLSSPRDETVLTISYFRILWYLFRLDTLWPLMPIYASYSPLCHRAQKSSYFFYKLRKRKWFSYYTVNGIRWKNGFKFLSVYFKHCHHYDFHFRSQILYSSDELKARQCRHPDIRYQDSAVFAVPVKVSISSSTISIAALSSFFRTSHSCSL